MKRFLSLMFLTGIFSETLMSQSIYVRGGGGYNLPIATSVLGENFFRSQIYSSGVTTNSGSVETVKGSFGAGTNFNFAIGYKFNENFIFELNTQYLISNKYKTSEDYTYTDNTDPQFPYSYVENYSSTTSARALLLNPSFIFSAGFGKAAPYGRFGFIIGSPKVSGDGLSYYNGDGVDSTATSWEYTKGVAFGFQGAVGMNWKLTEKIDIYTELNFVNMTYYAGEYNLTKNISNNFGNEPIDNLPNISTYQKQTIFKKKFDPTTVNNEMYQILDPTKPQTALRESTPFSSVSIQAGIRFNLWKKAE